MGRFIKNAAQFKGLPPGFLLEDGRPTTGQLLSGFVYNPDSFEEISVDSLNECPSLKDSRRVTWLNIESPPSKLLEELKELLGVHPLVLEDVLQTSGQRPKLEDYGDYLFIVAKMLYEDSEGDILAEQISLIVGPNYVFSFQERPGDVFDVIRNRIKNNKGQVRKGGADYLGYALLDAVIDHYFVILEKIDGEIENLDEKLVANSSLEVIHDIHDMKQDMVFLKKQIWPLREVVNVMQRSETKLIKKTTKIYLRDLYDHTIQVMETVESFRDILSSMHDVYLSMVSNRMNEVMKVLTIFAAIFVPLTFIAGVYGMNFHYMPELNWRWGYFAVLGVMALVALTMIVYFKKKNWL